MAEESKKETKIELTQIATQTQPAYQLPNGEVIGLDAYMVWLGNHIVEIKDKLEKL
tara:strand:- start:600 stop:767 length:168 start_codon:yes stop_codon:yes gene_type:complete